MNEQILLTLGAIALIGTSLTTPAHAAKPVLVNLQIDVEDEADGRFIHPVLEPIESRGWRTTVYFTGEFAAQYPSLVKDIHDRKHQIAVCGWRSGEDLTILSYQAQLDSIRNSIMAVRRAISNFHQAYVADFRPQGLRQNEDTLRALEELKARSNTAYLASEGKTHPYHTDFGFVAIPVAAVHRPIQSISLMLDEATVSGEAPVEEYLGRLIERYDESLKTTEPFTIIIRASTIGSSRENLQAFGQCLDYIRATNGQVVMTDHMTTLANPYMSDLKVSVPDFAYSGRPVLIKASYYAHCDCPKYYIAIYGKYPGDAFWQRLDDGQFVDEGASVGPHEKSGLVPVPCSSCNDPNYMLMAVGRACHGVCWPTHDSYEQKYEAKVRLKNPKAGERINGIERTDVPGVDRFCPISGGQCVELKPGDLLRASVTLFLLRNAKRPCFPG